jgi:TonB family protein
VIGAGGAAHEASRAGTVQAGSRGARPIVLAWAIAASVVVHAALLIATLPGGKPGLAHAPPALRASLVAVEIEPQRGAEVPAPVPPVLTANPDQSTFSVPSPERAVAAPPRAPQASRAGWATMEVAGEPLADRSRLGWLGTRQTIQFPAEIDRPVRMDDRIVARYPAAALAQGREESVVVWVVVGESGEVEEVQVAEGSEDFAREAVAAVRAAHFHPAENNLKPIRFAIALQFDFRLRAAATSRASTK